MSRLVKRLIHICAWRDEAPLRYQDADGTLHTVEEWIDRWSESGDWWAGEGERIIYRIATRDGVVADLERTQNQWFIYRVWD
ncbi:MAG: hypothetical protein OWT28_00405 [Firmicutes bacterium]|nr:hypothetical protein [Bacillota bacterium]